MSSELYFLGLVVIVFFFFVFAGLLLYTNYHRRKNRFTGGLKIVLNEKEKTATLWRNLHPYYWRYHNNRKLILPGNVSIEIHPDKVDSPTLLHELGHLMIDIAWLNEVGSYYYKLIRATEKDEQLRDMIEFMSWGVGARLGKISVEWLHSFCMRVYAYRYGRTKVRMALMVALSTPLLKKEIVKSTRRIGKILSL